MTKGLEYKKEHHLRIWGDALVFNEKIKTAVKPTFSLHFMQLRFPRCPSLNESPAKAVLAAYC